MVRRPASIYKSCLMPHPLKHSLQGIRLEYSSIIRMEG